MNCNVSYWDRMSTREIRKAREYNCSIIIPLGVIEAHGPLLPTGLDAMLARVVAHLTAERMAAADAYSIVFDCIPYSGIVGATDDLLGTISFPAAQSTNMLFIAIQKLYEQGFRTFFLVNGDAGTGKCLIPFLFRTSTERQDFFRAWKGTLALFTWFEGIEQVGHASIVEHAVYTYLCQLADEHTREVAASAGIITPLKQQDLRVLDGTQRVYPKPRREIFSWAKLPGQSECEGVSSFSFSAYQEMIDSGKIISIWETQLKRITEHMLQILGVQEENVHELYYPQSARVR
ncbi:MAG: Uncharacterized protein G01um101470_150 [Parcubacteria group bacterium Gr01-1014_70]|nr:MAG: Uncharacterized protein G01um101470_150 [Parcubacteria group bacterium Gr01-1014_70]